jgi:hypothetical protein
MEDENETELAQAMPGRVRDEERRGGTAQAKSTWRGPERLAAIILVQPCMRLKDDKPLAALICSRAHWAICPCTYFRAVGK